MNLKTIPLLLAIGLTLFGASGCSVYMAANQDDAKEMSIITEGQPRSVMLGEFGQPVSTVTRSDGTVEYDVFSFRDGYSGGAKAGRALFHGVADVFTLGLWEIVGTPVEAVANGDQMSYKIFYDEHGEVSNIVPLSKDAQKYDRKRTRGASPQIAQSAKNTQKTAGLKQESHSN
ncbi:MAG: hypothetical protein BA863_14765 [Desulfovibrio sp. S3730MH75]|nr:MAG: hypothetical protein BA863_14765 [Desulfovibrio sp. S3730MH75]